VHYSVLLIKNADIQVVGGEKSPSEDGLKVSTATKYPASFSPLLRWPLSLTPVT
jgi:hypothetical protein